MNKSNYREPDILFSVFMHKYAFHVSGSYATLSCRVIGAATLMSTIKNIAETIKALFEWQCSDMFTHTYLPGLQDYKVHKYCRYGFAIQVQFPSASQTYLECNCWCKKCLKCRLCSENDTFILKPQKGATCNVILHKKMLKINQHEFIFKLFTL